MVVGADLCVPADDPFHDLVEGGELAGGVELDEAVQRLVGGVEVVGLVGLVEPLQGFPAGL